MGGVESGDLAELWGEDAAVDPWPMPRTQKLVRALKSCQILKPCASILISSVVDCDVFYVLPVGCAERWWYSLGGSLTVSDSFSFSRTFSFRRGLRPRFDRSIDQVYLLCGC